MQKMDNFIRYFKKKFLIIGCILLGLIFIVINIVCLTNDSLSKYWFSYPEEIYNDLEYQAEDIIKNISIDNENLKYFEFELMSDTEDTLASLTVKISDSGNVMSRVSDSKVETIISSELTFVLGAILYAILLMVAIFIILKVIYFVLSAIEFLYWTIRQKIGPQKKKK